MCGFVAIAQEDSDPLKNIDTIQMKKFTGKWEWRSKTNDTSFTFIIKLRGQESFPMLQGWYQYLENGEVVINYLDSIDKVHSSCLFGFAKKSNDTLTVLFNDFTRNERSNGTMNFVKGDFNKLIFKINDEKRRGPHFVFGIEQKRIFKGKIPYDLNMIMTRIE